MHNKRLIFYFVFLAILAGSIVFALLSPFNRNPCGYLSKGYDDTPNGIDELREMEEECDLFLSSN